MAGKIILFYKERSQLCLMKTMVFFFGQYDVKDYFARKKPGVTNCDNRRHDYLAVSYMAELKP